MAHANFHLAAGIAVGTAATALPLVRAWLADAPLARPVARMLIVSYALGFWAVIPNAITTLGGSPSVHRAWWSNVFLGHAAIDRRLEEGLLIGELGIAAAFVAHYALILVALRRAKRLSPPRP
jgi:hypothetical protein